MVLSLLCRKQKTTHPKTIHEIPLRIFIINKVITYRPKKEKKSIYFKNVLLLLPGKIHPQAIIGIIRIKQQEYRGPIKDYPMVLLPLVELRNIRSL